ncbi:hypothetical protein KSP40_PGU008116 [Platanthera guangdongensis]|uniref:Uncharacterized protein n=1 Tax=Platanthera guangdongensis TaxID=2320717 RepID=A0ABR2LTZ9_9ASPA
MYLTYLQFLVHQIKITFMANIHYEHFRLSRHRSPSFPTAIAACHVSSLENMPPGHCSACSEIRAAMIKFPASTPILVCAKGGRGLNEKLLKCYCWGALVDPENTAPTNLVSAMNQVLLMVSAIFAYMAGVVPQRSRLDFTSDSTKKGFGSSSTTYGRSEISENESSSKADAVWVEVNKKLLGALDANLDNRAVVVDIEGRVREKFLKGFKSPFLDPGGPMVAREKIRGEEGKGATIFGVGRPNMTPAIAVRRRKCANALLAGDTRVALLSA